MTSVGSLVRHRWQGTYEIDPWGLDPELVSLVAPAAALRWHIVADGLDRVPADGPAVLIFSRRVGWTEPLVLAAAVRRHTGRHVRVVGCPDLAPIGPVLRRFGAVLANPDEVAGLLRAGELVAVPAGREPWRRRRAGTAPPDLLGPAGELGVPVVPVAVLGREAGRRWRVTAGEPLPSPSTTGTLVDAELADLAQRGLQDLFDAG